MPTPADPSDPNATVITGEPPGVTDTAPLEALAIELRETLAPGIQLLDKVGEGGMGTVFLGRDPALKRFVIVKVLSPDLARDERARARFAREAEAAAAVAHPNVVAIYHVGQLPRSGTSYIVMQHIEGPTLESAFPAGSVAPASRASRIVGEVAQALAAAHARGLVHRDIKPSNVMLDRESGRAVVLDFGISAALRRGGANAGPTRLTVEGASIGTPQYMSPEQASGEDVTDRSDVYSLGLVAFELAAGRPVFDEKTPMSLIAAHINREPESLTKLRPELDPAFTSLIDRCLVKNPAQRPSAAEVAKILMPESQAVIEWPPPGLERVAGRGWAVTRLGAIAALGVIGLMLLLYLQPAAAGGAWAAGESSWFWRAIWGPALFFDEALIRPVECSMRQGTGESCAVADVDASPLWLFALAVLTLALVAGALRILNLCIRLMREVRRARRSDYPVAVIMAAAWDSGPQTGHLLNGSGPFVMESDESRRRCARHRQTGDAWLAAGALASGVVPVLWLSGLLEIGDGLTQWVTLPELLVTLLPMLIGLAMRQSLRREERAILARWRRTSALGKAPTRPIAPSLVHGWMEAGRHLFRERPARQSRARMAPAAALAALTLVFAVPVLLITQVFSFWRSPTLKAWESEWLNFTRGYGVRHLQWASLDSMLGEEIARLASVSHERGRTLPAPGTAESPLRVKLSAFYPVDNQTYVRLRGDTAWRWLSASHERSDSILAGRTPRYVGTISTNMFAATVLAIEAGDIGSARARVRSGLIQLRHRLASFAEAGAMTYGLRASNQLHGEVAQATGDTIGARFARDLDARMAQFLVAHRFFIFVPFTGTLMADPDAPPALAILGDRRQAPSVRRVLARSVVAGQCYNGREMLFGQSERRRALIVQARTLVADLPGANAAIDSAQAAADSVLGGPQVLGLPRRVLAVFRQVGSGSPACASI